MVNGQAAKAMQKHGSPPSPVHLLRNTRNYSHLRPPVCKLLPRFSFVEMYGMLAIARADIVGTVGQIKATRARCREEGCPPEYAQNKGTEE